MSRAPPRPDPSPGLVRPVPRDPDEARAEEVDHGLRRLELPVPWSPTWSCPDTGPRAGSSNRSRRARAARPRSVKDVLGAGARFNSRRAALAGALCILERLERLGEVASSVRYETA